MYVGGIYTLQYRGPGNNVVYSVHIKNKERKCFLAISKVLIPNKPNQNNSNNNKMVLENIRYCKDDFQSTPPEYLTCTSILDVC